MHHIPQLPVMEEVVEAVVLLHQPMGLELGVRVSLAERVETPEELTIQAEVVVERQQ